MASAFVLTIAGFSLLTLGGWLGGTVVFVHGMRVLDLVDEPASRPAAPVAPPSARDEDYAAAGAGTEEASTGGEACSGYSC